VQLAEVGVVARHDRANVRLHAGVLAAQFDGVAHAKTLDGLSGELVALLLKRLKTLLHGACFLHSLPSNQLKQVLVLSDLVLQALRDVTQHQLRVALKELLRSLLPARPVLLL